MYSKDGANMNLALFVTLNLFVIKKMLLIRDIVLLEGRITVPL